LLAVLAAVPVTQAQRALLQLLLSGRQSYSELASLLGAEPSWIRAQAREALEAIAGEDPDRTLPLTDYLLGQADEATARATARRLAEDGETSELARLLCSQLTEIAPASKLPATPVGEPPARPHRGRAGKTRFGQRTGSGSSRFRPQAVLRGAASAVRARSGVAATALIASFILVAAALVIGGVFGSGDSGSTAGSSSGSSPGTIATVEGAPSGLGEISKASYERTLAQTAAADGLKAAPRPGDSSYTAVHDAAIGSLLQAVWIQAQARQVGISVKDSKVAAGVAKLKRRYKTAAAYKRSLRQAHFSNSEIQERVKLQLLITKIERQVAGGRSTKKAQQSALSRFSRTYASSWTGRTTCASGYVVQGCSNYVAPQSGTTTTTP
jgi:SurA-like N-terminal domain